MTYPLKFKPLYKDYIWGGRELESLGKVLPAGIVAESWEISSHKDGDCIVANGELEGKSLSEVVKMLGRELVGSALPEKDVEKFPLLIKLIDANDKLSVQVHPEDEYAKLNENGELGKNEMWYVLAAKPGAKIVYGVAEGVTKDSFARAVEQDNIEACLNFLEVSAGDTVNIPAGLIHAIGDGILIAEIQQNSNTTYRVYDYNRKDAKGNKRPLHIDKALQVIDFNNCSIKGKQKGLKVKLDDASLKEYIVANEYFAVEKYDIDGEIEEATDGSRFYTFTCLEGKGEISYSGGAETLKKGESVLLPAALGKYSLSGKLKLLKASVPDVEKDVICSLKDAGYSIDEIKNNVLG
jgi:mannose-6-phosphate isomerase